MRSTRRRADRLSRRSAPWPVIAALVLVGAGCAATGPAPSPSASLPVFVATPSLVETKREVSAYVESGRYEADVAAVVDQARAFLESRVPRGGKLAIVLDIDETALSNLPSFRANDWGFVIPGPCDLPRGPCGLIAWIAMAQAEPIKPVLTLTRLARERASPSSSSPDARSACARPPSATSRRPATSGRACS